MPAMRATDQKDGKNTGVAREVEGSEVIVVEPKPKRKFELIS